MPEKVFSIINGRESARQILGCLMNKPELLDETDKYKITINDFHTDLDRTIFNAIRSLKINHCSHISVEEIENYLGDLKGVNTREIAECHQFLLRCQNVCDVENFENYYTTFKKKNLIKALSDKGFSVDKYINANQEFDEGENKYVEMSSEEIINEIKGELNKLESEYVINSETGESKASDDIDDLIKQLGETPEIGCQLQGEIFNSICRGGRKGKLYLRSAAAGLGKSRSMVGDACNIAYPIRFDDEQQKWILTGSAEKVLYVMTEQDTEEIKTMILAYLTGINEEKFLYGIFTGNDMSKIRIAIDIMKKFSDNMLFARIPDPCASVVQNLFRRYHQEYGVENFFYDYIFSSPSMLEEYKSFRLPEHVILRMFTTVLKNLAVELDSFILTSTQISNDDNTTGGFRDYHMIRGSKAIQDLVDFACIMSRPTQEELKQIEFVVKGKGIYELPNLVTDVFKNRRGRWTMVRIWSIIDLGICQKKDLFITSANMEAVDGFQYMDFEMEKTNEYDNLLEEYNKTNSIMNFNNIQEERDYKKEGDARKTFLETEKKVSSYTEKDWDELIGL